MRRLLLLVPAALCLFACGYHFPGSASNLPPDVRSLHVELFTNRTVEPFLENRITSNVIDWFARKGPLHLVEDRSRADALLTGVVTGYSSEPISYNADDAITEYRSKMTIAATLRQSSDDRVLWKGSLNWTEEYPANRDKAVQEDNEAAAIDVIAARLAQELYFRITENF